MSTKKTTAPAFQFYAQDFLTGVMYLTNEEIGMYIKMLAKQWTDEKIPKKRLGLLVGCEWDSMSDELREKFKDQGDYIVNTRLELERDKKISFVKKQSENGSKGGRPRKDKKPKLNPNETQQQSQKKPLEDEDEEERLLVKKRKENFLNLVRSYADKIGDGGSQTWMDGLYRVCKFEKKSLADVVKLFNNHLMIKTNGDWEKSFEEYRKHCGNWIIQQNQMGKLDKYTTTRRAGSI